MAELVKQSTLNRLSEGYPRITSGKRRLPGYVMGQCPGSLQQLIRRQYFGDHTQGLGLNRRKALAC